MKMASFRGFDMEDKEYKELEEKTWEEFRSTGLLWFINRIIHVFGWALVWDMDKNELYPAHTTFRGFGPVSEENGYVKITKMMMDNIDQIKAAFNNGELEKKDD